ncbi:MAG: segregation/condensation protein A [Candidatus Firestonebacteria bacterium]
MFNIVSKTFEGPFEVLLMLVKDDELDVNRVSVLDIVRSFSTKNINEGSDFIAGAANLIYMKSEALIPKEEEVLTEQDIDLQKLLEQYRQFKAIAGTLEKREQKQRDVFYKDVDYSGEFAEEQVLEVTLYDLMSCFKSVLAYLPKDEVMSISREGITVVQKTNELLEELETTDRIIFVEFLKKQPTKEHMIAAFLAMLELIRLGLISCKQNVITKDIFIMKKKQIVFSTDELREGEVAG